MVGVGRGRHFSSAHFSGGGPFKNRLRPYQKKEDGTVRCASCLTRDDAEWAQDKAIFFFDRSPALQKCPSVPFVCVGHLDNGERSSGEFVAHPVGTRLTLADDDGLCADIH